MSCAGFLRQAAVLAVLTATALPAFAATGPIRVSDNGRYFVDATGQPFYFLADTQWELFRRYSLDDARVILENRKAKGFTVVMVMLTGVGDGTGPNLEGDHPWLNDDPATPNPSYFAHVDAVLKLAQANDIQLLIGLYHQTYGPRMTVDNAQPWASWVTRRCRDFPNIMWTLYPKATDTYRPIIAKLAHGILEGDGGRHLISVHPDPSPASSSFLHTEPWLSFNSIQVWNRLDAIYPMTLADYTRRPPKPATMLEGVYEGGEEYGYPITPLLVRREAYYTCLAGGFHGYGHNDSWRVKPAWRSALDAPGARQMSVLKHFFTSLTDWWTLVPDQSVLATGALSTGDTLNLAARSSTGRWIIAYIAGPPTVTVKLNSVTASDSVSATWIDPVVGTRHFTGTFATKGTRSFTRPADWQDALLVLKSVDPKVLLRDAPPVQFRGANSAAPDRPGDTDCNSPAHWDGSTLYVFNSAGHPWRSSGPDLFHLTQSYARCEYDNQANGGRWIECTWKADDGTLYGWYHNEPSGVSPGTHLTAPRIGALRSTDNGLHWHDLGLILEAPPNTVNCATTNYYFAGGNGDFCIAMDAERRFIYFYISTYTGSLAEQGVSVARMLYVDRDNPVGKVWKWRNGRWTEPGLGGRVSAILPARQNWHRPDVDAFWGPSIHWNHYLNEYAMLLNRAIDPHWKQEGIYVSYNPDLANTTGWTAPRKILGDLRPDHWYPSVIGLDIARRETDKLAGRTARLFVRGRSQWEITFLRPAESTNPPTVTP